MSIKQRFQHLTLGDTVRLQNFLYDNDASADQVAQVPKVEVYRVDQRLATAGNPRGLVRKSTLVRRPGLTGNQISPHESISSLDYWEGQLELDPDQWEIGKFVDKWFLVLDQDADISDPVAEDPYSPQQTFSGLKPINVDHVSTSLFVSAGSKTFTVRSGLSFSVGDLVRLYYDDSTYLQGTITAYSNTSMTVNVASTSGSAATHSSWLLTAASNTNVTRYVADLGQNRLPVTAGISTTSSTYLVSTLTAQMAAHATAFSGSSAAESGSTSSIIMRYPLVSNGEQIVTDGKRASSADAADFPTNFLAAGTYYTAYGKFLDPSSVVVGYFKIKFDPDYASNVMTVLPASPLPSSYPASGNTTVEYIPGTDRISGIIDVVWSSDPGGNTSVSSLSYALYEPVPSQISSASSIGIGLVVESGFTTLGDGSHVDAVNNAYGVMNTTDGGATWNGSTYSTGADGPVVASVQGAVADGKLIVDVTWNSLPPVDNKISLYYVNAWDLTASYDPSASNAWNDMPTRLGGTKVMTVEHTFEVHPSLFVSSARPIPVKYEFSSSSSEFYVGTRSWMIVNIKPAAELNPESIRFHYATISAGSLRYELFRLSADGKESRKILSGVIDWHEEASGMLRVDATTAPLNRAMNGFVVFYLNLPDGSMIRSARIFLIIIDDLKQGALTSGQVF